MLIFPEISHFGQCSGLGPMLHPQGPIPCGPAYSCLLIHTLQGVIGVIGGGPVVKQPLEGPIPGVQCHKHQFCSQSA